MKAASTSYGTASAGRRRGREEEGREEEGREEEGREEEGRGASMPLAAPTLNTDAYVRYSNSIK